jgi:hypothetical protein
MERKKTGRPSKGLRHKTLLRTPVPLHEAAVNRARSLGLTLNDYYVWLASQDTGVPASNQEGLLPLGMSA